MWLHHCSMLNLIPLCINIDLKIPNKIMAYYIQRHIKQIVDHDQMWVHPPDEGLVQHTENNKHYS